jgi:hypothetical protein
LLILLGCCWKWWLWSCCCCDCCRASQLVPGCVDRQGLWGTWAADLYAWVLWELAAMVVGLAVPRMSMAALVLPTRSIAAIPGRPSRTPNRWD